MKNIFGLTILIIGLISAVQAQDVSDIRVSHCTTDCGQVLVGAARLELDSIQWTGTSVVDTFILVSSNSAFDFTGPSNYVTATFAQNVWTINPPISTGIAQAQANGAAPSMGHYFAPEQSGIVSATQSYRVMDGLQLSLGSAPVVSGTGVADSETNPAITVDVEVTGASAQTACNDGSEQCTDVTVNTQSTVTFSVTPRVNSALVPQNAAAVQHVMVELQADEIGTSCTGNNLSFKDSGVTANNFVSTNYYHYLEANGPTQTPASCSRSYLFLVSVDNTFQFQTVNRRSTSGGRVDYHFFVRGHHDAQNLGRWPGSQPVFRLSTDTVTTQPISPLAAFSFLSSDLTVSLDATGSSDPDGTIVSYAWQSNDGTVIPAGETTQVTFPQAGTYTVTLTVTDNDGLTQTTSTQITVGNDTQPIAPTAVFTTAANELTVTLDASASMDTDGNIVSYQWQSNDGTSIVDGQTSEVTFPQAGTYSITLTVVDDDGLTDTDTQTVIVSEAVVGEPPVAAFSFQTDGLDVMLDASESSDSDGTIVGYQWQSNAGVTIADGEMAQATYPQDGTFTITLTVTDNDGQTNSISQAVTVSTVIIGDPPVASFTFQADNLNVMLNASTSSDPDDDIASYQWQSNGGVTIVDGQVSQVTYAQAGTFTITLTVTDSEGQSDDISQAVTVTEPSIDAEPVASFEITPNSGEAPLSVLLNAQASQPGSGASNITNYQWRSSNGTFIPSGPTQQVLFGLPGTYTITLTVTDDLGAQSITTRTLTVFEAVDTLTARFVATPSIGVAPLTVMLDAAASQAGPSQSIQSYSWRSSDGQTASGQTPTMTFSESGDYEITLIVIDSSLNADSITQTISVTGGELPSLGEGMAFAPDGTAQSLSGLTFSAGVLRTGGEFLANNASISQSETVQILGHATIPTEHLNLFADVLVVAIYTPPGQLPQTYTLTDNALIPFQLWDGSLASLSAAQSDLRLGSTLEIDIYQGPLQNARGDWSFFFGYRLTDGSIVFNSSQALGFSVF